jgi:alkylation response protein AidB-like acyl-CoA dehydrogenase
MSQRPNGRGPHVSEDCAREIGIAQEALRLVIDWVRTRTTFGTPLADR